MYKTDPPASSLQPPTTFLWPTFHLFTIFALRLPLILNLQLHTVGAVSDNRRGSTAGGFYNFGQPFIHFTPLPALSNFDGGNFLDCQTDNPDYICSFCIAFFLPCTTSSALAIYQRCLDSLNSSSSQAKDACTFRLLTAHILEQHLKFLSISSAHKQRNAYLPHISPILL